MNERELTRLLEEMPRLEFRARLRTELAAKAAQVKAVEENQMQAAKTAYLREGMHSVNAYIVTRDAGRLLDLIAAMFEGRERLRVPRPDGTIMHSEIAVGDSVIEVADGAPPFDPEPMALHVYVPDADAAYARAVQAGAESVMEPGDRDYGDREATVRDHAGNHWYIATHRGEHYTPSGLHSVTPYLQVEGGEGFIAFLKAAFGAGEVEVHRAPDGSVAHAKLRVGESVLELSDAHGPWKPTRSNIHLYVPDTDAIYAQALAAGATSLRAPVDEPYGDRSAGVADRWGNRWWLATWLGSGRG